MTLPETEVLTSLVARVFRVDDITAGDAEKGPLFRYRGQLLLDDSVAAYDQLAASVKSYRTYAPLPPGKRRSGDLPNQYPTEAKTF